MQFIPITTDYKNNLDDVVGRVEFIDTAAGNFAYEMMMFDPSIYRLEPIIEEDPNTKKKFLAGMTLVTIPRYAKSSERTVGDNGKTD